MNNDFYNVGLARFLIISNVFFAHNANASMKRASNELRNSLPKEKQNRTAHRINIYLHSSLNRSHSFDG